MLQRGTWPLVICILGVLLLVQAPPAKADEPSLPGQWYGTADSQVFPGYTETLALRIFEVAPGLLAGEVTVPALGLFEVLVPVTVDGATVTIGDPSYSPFEGTWFGDTISGVAMLLALVPPYYDIWVWTLWKDTGAETLPGPAPGTTCESLPPLFCAGSAAYCSELVLFDPAEGAGYVDYPANGETWTDQYRSWARRDLQYLVAYASAKVACKTSDWDYGNMQPLGLGDMSEEDGSIPGSSIGYPGHPVGTHEEGRDMDVGYYQLFATNNYMRPIGVHHDALGQDLYHLLEPPYALDVWRTALLLVYLSEHPRLRVVGVDGQAGPLLEDALDELVALGWVDAQRRAAIPLAYEVEDYGWGWFLFHHHHMHISLLPVGDLVGELTVEPRTLNRKSRGKTITAYLEMAPGYQATDVDPSTLALVLDGHTLLPALPKPCHVGDQDGDGIPDLMVKFDRQQVVDAVGTGDVELTLTGSADGEWFQETATIRVR